MGRRPLLVGSTFGIAFALFLLAFGISADLGVAITLTALCLFMASYAVGIGPVNMVLMSEIFPYKLRATAMSCGLFLNRLVSGIVASSFLTLVDVFTPSGTFFIFGTISTLSFLFVVQYVPETMGKSLEEMETFFADLVDETAPSQGMEHIELQEVDDLVDGSKLSPVSTRSPSNAF